MGRQAHVPKQKTKPKEKIKNALSRNIHLTRACGLPALLIYADKIEEIKTICWCGRKATMVARVVDGKIVKQGDQIVIGGNDMYVSLCRKHYNDGRLGPSK